MIVVIPPSRVGTSHSSTAAALVPCSGVRGKEKCAQLEEVFISNLWREKQVGSLHKILKRQATKEGDVVLKNFM